jgi:hypothetical protein
MKLLIKEGREITPESVSELAGGSMQVAVATAALEALKIMGDYDRIVAEAAPR